MGRNKWKAFKKKDFDMVLIGWHLSTIPDLTFAFHSSQIATGTNFINYKDEIMDELLLEAFSAPNRDNKLKSYKKIAVSYSKWITLYKSIFQKQCPIGR